MLTPSLVSTRGELEQILILQGQNLAASINESEKQQEGFVTMRHDMEMLEQMHRSAPSVIIKEDVQVVAYALTMLKANRNLHPGLTPMFDLFESLTWNGVPLSHFSWYVMGQVCVAKKYRGQGLVQMLYDYHKKIYQPEFDLILTEISTHNPRSIKAHQKTGFKIIHTFRDLLDEWVVVGWDWN